jgi:acetyl-CoA carboxylase biotin carboxylase subunit
VKGIKTTISFHARVMKNEKFIKGDIDTNFIDTQFQPQDAARIKPHEDIALVAAAIKAFLRDKDKTQRIMGGECECEDLSPWKSSGRVQRPSGL